MNDIFYFSDKKISVKDLFSVLEGKSNYKLLLRDENDSLQISLSENINVQIACMDIKEEFGDPEDLDVIESSGVQSSFCISHYSNSLPQVKELLALFLNSFGGWVGNDSEAFEPRYFLADISFFKYSAVQF